MPPKHKKTTFLKKITSLYLEETRLKKYQSCKQPMKLHLFSIWKVEEFYEKNDPYIKS